MSVNLQAPAVLAAGIAPHMAAGGRAQIVFIASMAGKMATLGNGPLYTATKWGCVDWASPCARSCERRT